MPRKRKSINNSREKAGKNPRPTEGVRRWDSKTNLKKEARERKTPIAEEPGLYPTLKFGDSTGGGTWEQLLLRAEIKKG